MWLSDGTANAVLKDRFGGKTAYADAREPTLAWYRHVVRADWRLPADLKRDFGTVSILRDGRAVFNIAIKFRMEQSGLTPKDLVPMIGRLNRVYEVLNRKRPLTLQMIWRLHRELGIPAESLIKQPPERRAA